MKHLPLALLLVVGTAAGLVPAQTTPPDAAAAETPATNDARALVDEAVRVLEQARAISFTIRVWSEGGFLGSNSPVASGEVRLLRRDGAALPWLARISGVGQVSQAAEQREVDAAWTESGVEWIDHTQRKVFERSTRAGTGPSWRVASAMRIPELWEPSPFQRLRAEATEFSFAGEQTVSGVPCDNVRVRLPDGSTVLLAIGRDDRLIRRIEQVLGVEGEATYGGRLYTELADVQAFAEPPPTISPALLRVEVPVGFERDTVVVPGATPPNPNARIGGVGTAGAPRPSPAAAPAPAPSGPPPLASAPGFELSTAQGEKVSLASLRGQVAILDFFGTWSAPSRAWHPTLVALAQRFKGEGVKVYAVAVRERNPATVGEYAAANLPDIPLLLSGDETARAMGITRFPATVVLGPAGEIVTLVQGPRQETQSRDIERALAQALERLQGGAQPASSPPAKPEEAPPAESKPAESKPEPAKPEPTKPE